MPRQVTSLRERSFQDIERMQKRKVAELTSHPESLISVEGTYTKYGFGRSIVHAYAYNNEESFKKFEVINKKKNGKEKKTKEQKAQ